MKYINYHKRKQTTSRSEEPRTRIPLRLWSVFIILVIANIWVAISSAAFGSQLMGMEREMKAVAEENKRLMESMVSEQSLQAVSSKAQELGMVEPTEVIYMNASTGLTASR